MPLQLMNWPQLPEGSSGGIWGGLARGLRSGVDEYYKAKQESVARAMQEMQKKKLEEELKYMPEEKRAALGLTKAHTDLFTAEARKNYEQVEKMKRIQNFISTFMNPNQNSQQGINNTNNYSPIPNQSSYSHTSQQQNIPEMQQTRQNQMTPQSQVNLNNSKSNMPVPPHPVAGYLMASLIGQDLGLGAPQIVDVNGTKTAISPFGSFPVAQGLTPEEESFKKGMGKVNADIYGENIKTANTLREQQVPLDEMINTINNDPEFRNVTGPINSFMTRWTGNSHNRELLGRLQSSSGEIALSVAPHLKGAFTGRDQTLLDSVKANPKTDFNDVFIGKLKAQKLISKVLEKRADLSAEYQEKGLSGREANKRAALEVPLEKYRKEIDKLVSGVREGFVRMKKGKTEYHIPEKDSSRAIKSGYQYVD